MIHLTVLLSICFLVQTLGYLRLRKSVIRKTSNCETGELERVVKKSTGYIALGLVIQLIIIISQIVVYFLFVRA